MHLDFTKTLCGVTNGDENISFNTIVETCFFLSNFFKHINGFIVLDYILHFSQMEMLGVMLEMLMLLYSYVSCFKNLKWL